VFNSCIQKQKDNNKKTFFYLEYSARESELDTIEYMDMPQPDSLDDLIYADSFDFNSKTYKIKAFTSDGHAPTDGGRYYLTLDTLGIIYSKSTGWPVFATLQSSNDSINRLLNQVLGFALMRQKFHCYLCCDYPDTTLLRPVVKTKFDIPNTD